MDNNLRYLFSLAIKPIMDNSINKCFLTQKEYEENYGLITLITSSSIKLENKLKELEILKMKIQK